jgi:MinD-like ATPase involved in chromosome partitioning or flagellar assembly
VLLAVDGEADLVIVDAPPEVVRDAQLRTYSEHVIVVTSPDLASIKDTRVVVSALAEGDAQRLGAVLNHPVDRRVHTGAEDVSPAIGVAVVAALPYDDHLGDPRHPVAIAPARSGFGHAIDELAARLAAVR